MKNVYFKKDIAICRINDYLDKHSDFFDCETEVLNCDDDTEEIQLLNYIEIPFFSIIINFCGWSYYNDDTEEYELDKDCLYATIRDDESNDTLYSEESLDIENLILNYLYDTDTIDNIDEYSFSKEFKSIKCNLVQG